jgi:phytanoyl-CoA hydroxylase
MMTKTEISSFWQENGFYVAQSIFSSEIVQTLETDFDRMVAQIVRTSGDDANIREAWGGSEMDRLDGGASVVLHCNHPQCFSANWMQALLNPDFLDVVEALVGPDIILHHAKLFQKPAEVGSPFPMHQDWPYFPSRKDTMLAGVIHLSRATDAMGCLRVYPGSHKIGRVQQNRGQLPGELIEKYPIEGATVIECEPGDVVFFNYLTLHGSMPNRSTQTRKTVLVQLHAGDDEIDPEGPAHPNLRLALRGWNHALTRKTASQAH